MANKAHLDCLKKGAAGWNRWRNENPEIIPDLREADLSETDFFGADLRNSELQQANFTQAKNLVNAQLGGANLSGATLPEDSLKFDGIYQVEHAIKYTQRIFVVMVLGCIYTWLTVASTSDANLITNSTVSPLPIIGNKIDIAGFYFVAPIILVCVYCYLHIYLQRLWERLAILPAFFPDGQPLDQKILPWFPTGLLYKHFVHLSKNAPPLARLQTWISIGILWLLLPVFTLPIIWLGYFPQHFWPVTLVHVVLILVTTWFGTYSYLLARKTLQNRANLLSLFWPTCMSCFAGLAWLVLSYGGFQAVHQHFNMMQEVQSKERGVVSIKSIPNQFVENWFQRFILRVFGFVAHSPLPNLEGADVSIKPSNWTGDQIDTVVGARLNGRHLSYTNAPRAFLVNAELGDADLQRANLVEADLRRAKLGATKLAGAYLIKAKLQSADLTGADLRGAFLMEANFVNANFFKAEAEKAWLNGANLQGANLQRANFQCVDFRPAEMGWAEVYDYKVGSSKGHHIFMISLKGANFDGADLQGTRLEGARLTNVVGLTQPQLDKACVNERTLLPPGLSRPIPCKLAAGRFVPTGERKTPYSEFAIGSLQDEALKFVMLSRNFILRLEQQQEQLAKKESSSDVERKENHKRDKEEAFRSMQKHLTEFNRQFKERAISLRQEMLSRLPEQDVKPDDSILYAFPKEVLGMREVADNLEKLAERLCPL